MEIEYEFGDGVFTYEPDWRDVNKALVEILCENMKEKHGSLYDDNGAYQMAMYIVNDLDATDRLCENLEEELKDYFQDKARQEYQDACDNASEEESWYGTKNDVIGL